MAVAALAGVSAGWHAAESADRRAAVDFLRRYELFERRPEVAETALVEGAADLAMGGAVRAATLDLSGSTRLGELDAERRAMWLRSVERLSDEEADAVGLALRAFGARPAWAFAAAAVAELELAADWRRPAGERRPERWLKPLRVAASWAPSAVEIQAVWSAAALERWNLLGEKEREEAARTLRRALESEAFLRRALPAAVEVLGRSRALGLLPASSSALAVAKEISARTGTFEEQVALEERWEAAERQERRDELRRIEALRRAGRLDRAAESARAFLAARPPELFDDEEGRAQALAVARAVGDGSPGTWAGDPRGALIRFLLASPARRGGTSSAADILRASKGLADVPEPVRARLLVAAGDDGAFDRLVEEADTIGSVAWTPVWIEHSRRFLERGDVLEAQALAGRISRFAAGECDVLLLRRDVARARSDREGLASATVALADLRSDDVPVSSWVARGAAGRLEVCVDPERDGTRFLVLRGRLERPALVWWGWDGGRTGRLHLEGPGEVALAFPLSGLEGRRSLGLGALAGGMLVPHEARVEPVPPPGSAVAAAN